MTNEEKIEELAEKSPINWISKEDKCTYRQGFVCGATKIAKWKDEEHTKEKQQWIERAMKVICDGCAQKAECEFKNWKTCCTKEELIKSMGE